MVSLHNKGLVRTSLGFVFGLVAGSVLSFYSLTFPLQVVELMGDLFLRSLRMIVVPLIFPTLALSIADLGDVARLSRLSGLTIGYYLVTNAMAVTTGLLLVNLFQPGVGMPLGEETAPQLPDFRLSDLIRRTIPNNPFQAVAEGETLAIIFLSLLFGAGLLAAGEKGKPVRSLLTSGLHVTVVIVHWLIALAPIGVFSLSAHLSAEFGLGVLIPLSRYVFVVVLGLAVHGLIFLPLSLYLITKTSPFVYLRSFFPALLTAFTTSSSSATLPVTLDCAETAGVSRDARSFVLPLGATINMDGTALYEAVAAVFVAQAYGIPLSLPQQLLVFLTANMAAIGAAGIPAGGLVTMPLVYQAVGIPLAGLTLILPVDRFLDMFRTTVNVEGDIIGCQIVAQLYHRDEGTSPPPNPPQGKIQPDR